MLSKYNNLDRLAQLREIVINRSEPVFRPGDPVGETRSTGFPRLGRVDAIYADFQAATDGRVVPRNWYEIQEVTPRTPKNGYWYSVILTQGAILAGEDDLYLASRADQLPPPRQGTKLARWEQDLLELRKGG